MTRSQHPELGTVAELWVFPVKSMQGASLPHARVDADGVRGDRSWAVADRDGRLVTASEEPRLRAVTPEWDGDAVSALRLPDGRRVRPAEAGPALSQWLGREVRLVASEAGQRGFVDVAPVHLVSRGGLQLAASPEHAATCTACDVRDPRANVVLELLAGGDAERGLVGRILQIGASRLRVVRHPDHCLGVYAEVAEPGAVAVGDDVRIAQAGGA